MSKEIKAYHSTEAKFNKFDKQYIGLGAGTSFGNGFYFGSEPIDEYGKPMEVTLLLDNPYEFDYANDDEVLRFLQDCGCEEMYFHPTINDEDRKWSISKTLEENGKEDLDLLKDKGYDSLIIHNTPVGMKTKKVLDSEYLVWDTNKIIIKEESFVVEKIVKIGNKWQVQSEKGRNLGTYDTKQEAEDRLKQVHYFKHVNEELLQEKTRQELINKSKSGAEYSKKNQARGKNRWERRKYSQVANSIRDYNSIDMDAFFKGDILEFKIKVHGETDDYVVTILFEGILSEIRREVQGNNNKLEFKCVLRALLKVFNSEDVYVSCTCPDFTYRFKYWASHNNYSSAIPDQYTNMRPKPQGQGGAAGANSDDTKGSACKHVNLVISNLDWMMKIASVINNYIKWCKENMERNYADYIFPQIYGMPYNKAVQLSLFDDPNDNGYLLPDAKAIFDPNSGLYKFDTTDAEDELGDIIKNTALKGKDSKGRWTKGNQYRFQKKEVNPSVDDNPNQMHLNFGDDNEKELVPDEED